MRETGTAPTPPSVVAGNPKTNDFTSYGVLDDSASDGQFLSGFGGGVAPEMEVDEFDEFEGASTLVAEDESEWYAEDAGMSYSISCSTSAANNVACIVGVLDRAKQVGFACEVERLTLERLSNSGRNRQPT
jgi:hypothetical protein